MNEADQNESNSGDTALLATEYSELVDQATQELLDNIEAAEQAARTTAAEIIDLGMVLMADFAGTDEFKAAKRLVDKRIDTKLKTLGVETQNRGREVARKVVMGLLLGARTIVVGRIAP